MQEQMSDSEDGDSDYDDLEINDTSAILNLNPAYGQTIALWSFRKHDSIAIFPPSNDLISRVVHRNLSLHLQNLTFVLAFSVDVVVAAVHRGQVAVRIH
jgi:hypothetical protein